MDSIWVEKHRPQTLDDFVGNEAAIKVMKGFVETGRLMHVMLAGPPGVGKTSSLHCVARSLLGPHFRRAFLELNAADERGIDVVREKIKDFAKEKVDLPSGQTKIILLDEADSMLDGAQQALRRLMETYCDSTRFTFACNQSEKVIDAVQSRCCVVRFSKVSDSQMMIKLKSICDIEKVPYEEEALKVVIEASEGDMRKAIGSLQAAAGAYGAIEISTIHKACDIPPGARIQVIVDACNKGLWRPAHEEVAQLIQSGYTTTDILKAMKNAINNTDMPDIQRTNFLREVSYVFCAPERHKINLLQMDKLICALCKLKKTPVEKPMRAGLLLLAARSVLPGTLPDGDFDPEKAWIKDVGFYEDFDRLERRQYFYPRGVGYLNDQPVFFKFLNETNGYPEVADLAAKCGKAQNQRDFVMHSLLLHHEWLTDDDSEATFFFVPTFAGIVLAGECEPDAEEILAKLMVRLRDRPQFKQTHGHDLMMYSSSEAVHDRHRERAQKIVQEHMGYDTEKMSQGDVSVIDYMMSQMVSLEAFYRPNMQFCQLFVPPLLPGDAVVGDKKAIHPQDMPIDDSTDWASYVASRPLNLVMMEGITREDPKYAVRLQAYETLADSKNKIVALNGLQQATECRVESIEKPGATHCVLNQELTPFDVSQVRQRLFANAKFALITRGATPHPDSFYDALAAGTLIINTIDKSLDMALPFQCQVPWEDFTIRLPTAAFQADPQKTVTEALQALSPEEFSKKLKLQKYYRRDLLVLPGFEQETLIVENIMLNALKRCQDEQLLIPRNKTRWGINCPHMDYGKVSILKRTLHNCDMPPWQNF